VIKDTGTSKGRGVFTLAPYEPNQLVEVCPVVVFDVSDLNVYPVQLRRIVFAWSILIGKVGLQRAIALGCASMYNHANPANLRFQASRITRTLTFRATRAIARGEELTINYDKASGYDSSPESVWMKREGITPV
jgi:hypothetical protein